MADTETLALIRSPYEVLQISRWADPEEIKAHYYHLVREYNPEYHEEEFIEIRAAYDVLRDANRRAAVDVETFIPPPPLSYSDYPEFPRQPLSMFKLNQEMKALAGGRSLDELDEEGRKKGLHILRGMVLYHAHHQNLGEAEALIRKILELDPNDEETRENQVHFLWKKGYDAVMSGQFAASEEFFMPLGEQGTYPALVYQNLALAQEKQGKKKEAEESWNKTLQHLKQALHASPDEEYLKALVIPIHKYTGGKFLEGATPTSAGTPVKELGFACIRQGNWKQAVGALEQARGEDENDVDVLCQLGWAYLNTNQHPKAFHMWNLALRKAPGRQQITEHLVRGYVIFGKRLKEQRIFNQALVQFKNAIKYEPQNLELRTLLAETYFKMNNYYAATQEYLKILEMDPRHKDARQGIREAKRLGGFR